MSRARGANAQLALAFNSGAYGAIPASGYFKMPFVSSQLGEEQGLIESDLLGFGREALPPSDDVANDSGDVVVPVDLRYLGLWLKLFFGPAVTTTGIPASGHIAFSAQPANNATISINGTDFTFTTATPGAGQIKIGATLADTIRNAVVALNASAVAGVAEASYASDADLTRIEVTHDTVGTGGNAFTLAASTSPVSNGTVSAATLAGGAATGAKRHLFQSGALDVPNAAVEVGLPDVPSYGMNFGVVANSLAIAFQRSGHLNATLGLIAKGEQRGPASGAGTPTEMVIERFSQFSGQVQDRGVILGDVVSGRVTYSNNIDTVEVIRPDGRIAGADGGTGTAMVELVARFRDNTFFDLATSKTPIEVKLRWTISATKFLEITLHYVRLPKPKLPVEGPRGVQSTFTGQASRDPVLLKTISVLLVNDVADYA